MKLNSKQYDLGALTTFQTQCPYCERWFELQGYAQFQPKKMVCSDCQASYEAKVQANFKLDDASERAAKVTGSMEDCGRRRERLEIWQQLSEQGCFATRCKYSRMLRAANNVIKGIDEPVERKARKSRWSDAD